MDEYVPIWSSSSIKLSRPFNDNDNVNKQGYSATLSRLERWQKPWGSLRKESKGTARKAAWFVGISPSRDGVRATHSAWLLPRAPRLLMERRAERERPLVAMIRRRQVGVFLFPQAGANLPCFPCLSKAKRPDQALDSACRVNGRLPLSLRLAGLC